MARNIVFALAPDGTNLFRLVDRSRALADALGGALHVVLLGLPASAEERARRLEQAYRLCRDRGGQLHVYYDEVVMANAVRRLGRAGRGVLGAVVEGADFCQMARWALPALYDAENKETIQMGGAARRVACVHG